MKPLQPQRELSNSTSPLTLNPIKKIAKLLPGIFIMMLFCFQAHSQNNSNDCVDVVSTCTTSSLRFDGSNDRVALPNQITLGAEFTLEYWVKHNGHDQNFDRITSTTIALFETAKTASGELTVHGLGRGWRYTGVQVSSTDYDHIAWVFEGTTLTLYQNGVEVYSDSDRTADTRTTDWFIGGSVIFTELANVSLDEIRLWDSARSIEDINANASPCAAIDPQGLTFRFSFDEGSGTTTTEAVSGTAVNIDGGVNWQNDNVQTEITTDEIPPTVVTQNIPVSLGADGTVTISAAQLDGGSDDNAGAENLTFTVDGATDVTFDCDDLESTCTSGSLRLDGNDDRVALPNQIALGNSFTLEYWVKHNGSDNTFDRITSSGRTALFETAKNGSGRLAMHGLGRGWKTTTVTISSTEYDHIAWVFDGSTVRLYQNGVEEWSDAGHSADTRMGDWSIGSAIDGANVSIDEVRLWDSARTAQQISDNASPCGAIDTQGLVFGFSFDEGTGTTTTEVVSGDAIDIITGGTPNWQNDNVQTTIGVPVTLTAQDACGNSATGRAVVTVEDNLAPTINLNGDATIELNQGGTYTETATAVDNCSEASLAITGSVNTGVVGVYTLTYIATDDSGNQSAPVTRTVEVVSPITITPWRINDVGTDIVTGVNQAFNGDPAAYQHMDIPETSDGNWAAAPLDGNGAILFGGGNASKLGGFACRTALDFTYFETFIDIPANTSIDELSITFGAADDGARAYIFNSENPDGAFRGQIALGDGNAFIADYSDLAVAGELNRLIIAQFDDCATGNNLSNAQVTVDGSPLPVDNSSPPVVVVQDIIVSPGANGSVTLEAANVDDGSFSTLAGPVTLTLDQSYNFSCDDLGSTTQVTLTATDTNGLSTSATANVTIEDNIAPTVNLNGDAVINLNQGDSYTETAVAEDNCAGTTLEITGTVNTATLGSYVLNYTATDASGNESTASRTVNVLDVTPPVAAAQDITVQLDANGNATITPEQIDNGSSDNSGSVTLSLDQTAFDCDDLESTCESSSLRFNGGNNRVALNDQIALGTSFTLEYWIKHNGSDASFDRITSTRSALFETAKTGSGELTVHGLGRGWRFTGVRVSSTDYDHIAWVFEGNTLRLYQNGVEVYSDSDRVADTRTNDWFIGGTWFPSEFGNFSIDELRLWDSARSIEDINGNASPCTAIDTQGLVFRFAFDEGNGTTTTEAVSGDVLNITGSTSVWENDNEQTTTGVPVTLTVEDAAGNTTTANALVTVEDNIAPAVNLNGDTVINLNQNEVYTETATAEDNCVADLEITGTVDTATAGTYVLNYTATDASGNESTATRTVNVLDVTPPVAVARDITVQLDANGNVIITPAQINNGSSDNSGGNLTYQINGQDQLTLDCDDALEGFGEIGALNFAQGTVSLDDVNGIPVGNSTYTIEAWVYPETYGPSPGGGIVGWGGYFNVNRPNALRMDSNLNPPGFRNYWWNNDIAYASPNNLLNTWTHVAVSYNGTDRVMYVDGVEVERFTNNQVNVSTADNFAIGKTVGNEYFDGFIHELRIWNDARSATEIADNKDIRLSGSEQGLALYMPMNEGAGSPQDQSTNGASGTIGGNVTWGTITSPIPTANVVTLTVTDEAGNTSTATATITVEDNIAPQITGPSDIDVNATSAAGAIVTYVAPEGTDNCAVTTELTAGLASGATFPLGTTVVTYTATDASGNEASASFNVTVEGLAPEIVVPANITVNNDSGVCGAIVNFAATETVGIPASLITYNIIPGSSFNIGTATVTATATNAVGTSTKSFTVTVEDNEAPVITMNGSATVQHDAFTAYNDAGATTSDNCSATLATTDNVNINVSGTYAVTYTSTDASGNQTVATRTVVVRDVTVPIAIAQDITVELDASGNANITADDINNGSSDDSGQVTLSLDQTDFDCADLSGITPNKNSLEFNGTQLVSIPDAPELRITGDITLEGWFKATANTGDWVMIAGKGGSSDRNYGIWYNINEGKILFLQFAETQLFHLDVFNSNFTINLNEWYHIAGVKEGNVGKVYVNGQLVATRSVEPNTTPITSDRPFEIGFHEFHSEHIGQIDEVRLWNLARTDQEIAASYNVGLNGDEPGLVAYYNMDAGAGSVLSDLTSNGNNSNQLTGTWSTEVPTVATQANGVEITLTVEDPSGNVSTATALVTVEDNIAPEITAPADIDLNATSAAGAVVNYTAPVGTDNCSVTTALTTGLANGATFPIGTTMVTYTATDGSGNATSASFNVTVTGLPPEIVVPANITVSNDAGECGALVNFEATETTAIPLSTITYDIQPGTFFPVGTTTVTATATNPVGTSTKSFTVTVEDNEAPNVITQDFVVDLDASGNGSITVANINAGSGDNCDVDTITLDKTVFDCTNVGANIVTLTVTDIHGNSASNTASVIVRDVIAPAVVTQNITIELNASGNASITTADIDNGSNDACGIASMVLDITSFDCTNTGVNTVTLTVTDNNDNVSSNTAIVTVVDNEAPTVITKNITVALDGDGIAAITPAAVDDGSFDNCSFTLSLDNSSFDCTTLGENTVMLTATDASNNSTSLAATVTVIDNAAPTIVTNPITVELDENGSVSIVASQVDGGTTDNCAVASVEIDITSFDCSNLGDNIVTITATDVNGNVSSGPVVVSVIDVIAPIVGTQNISVDLDANGNASITPEEVLILSADDIETDENCTVSAAENHAVWLSQYVQAGYGKNKGSYKGKGKKKGHYNKPANTRFVFDNNGGGITRNTDGTATVSGTMVNTSNPEDRWIVSLSLENARNWEEWSSLGRSYKDEQGLAGNKYQKWTYYEMSPVSKLIGAGDNAGEEIALSHAPTDYRYGFQLGEAANSKNANFGMSGWFFYRNRSGKMVQGDFSLDVANCESEAPPAEAVITSDNCSIASTSLDVSSFSCGNLGENIVNVTVTDGSGNATTVPVTVTVNDPMGPTAVAQDITVSLGADGTVVVDPSLLDGGSTDNCGIVSWSLDRDTFDCGDIQKSYYCNGRDRGHKGHRGKGRSHKYGYNRGHKVTLTVTDAAGHTDSATAYVTVVDDVAPVISSEPITLVVYGRKKAYLTRRDVAQAVTDNCGVRYISFSRSRYDRRDAGENTVMVSAVDKSGNKSIGEVTVNVIDISSYGKYVTMCYKGRTRRVRYNQVQHYLRKGAVLGTCNSGISEVASDEPKEIEILEDAPSFTTSLSLSSYPNPTAGYTVFSFSSNVSGPARLAIMNTNGVQLATLFNDELEANEEVEIGYEAGALPSGIYIVRLVTGGTIKNVKLMVRK